MIILVLLAILNLAGSYYVEAVQFQIKNNLPGAIWVGILGNGGKAPLNNGGFILNAYEQKDVNSPSDWAGRFWARTWCDPNTKNCGTGSCGPRIECNGAGGEPPVTLVEITLHGSGDQDFYDISLVDGFNVAAKIEPLGGRGNCRTADCPADLNPDCPAQLRIIGAQAGYTIACRSSCNKFNTDQYCCRGSFGTPQTCNINNWPVNSARYFKSKCPNAYSYAYDDPTSTFTCAAQTYRITFG